MPKDIDPIVDNWYYHLDKGQSFCVIAVDEDNRVVEIQHFDGDVEEVDFTDWYTMNIEVSEAPENWGGAVDIGNIDDYGTEITETKGSDWNEPLKEIKRPQK